MCSGVTLCTGRIKTPKAAAMQWWASLREMGTTNAEAISHAWKTTVPELDDLYQFGGKAGCE